LAHQLDELRKPLWHRNCYRDAVYTGIFRRAKERYESHLEGLNKSILKSWNVMLETLQLTR